MRFGFGWNIRVNKKIFVLEITLKQVYREKAKGSMAKTESAAKVTKS